MAAYILVNIGSGVALLPNGTKPFPESKFQCGSEALKRNAFAKLPPQPPGGANGLMEVNGYRNIGIVLSEAQINPRIDWRVIVTAH